MENINYHTLKKQAINWANQHEVCLVLDNNESINAFGLHHIKFAMACGVKSSITGNNQNDFEKNQNFTIRVPASAFDSLLKECQCKNSH